MSDLDDAAASDVRVQWLHASFLTAHERPLRVGALQFALLSAAATRRAAELDVRHARLYHDAAPTRPPCAGGVLDPRLGALSAKRLCGSCGRGLALCAGHFGQLPLALPLFHVGFFAATKALVERVCRRCARILLAPQRRDVLWAKWSTAKSAAARRRVQADAAREAKATGSTGRLCGACGAFNGPVKKVHGLLKLQHECYTRLSRRQTDLLSGAANSKIGVIELKAPTVAMALDGARKSDAEVEQHYAKATEDLNARVVLELFRRISDEDCCLLGFKPAESRPEEMILTNLIVPPVTIRPSVTRDAAQGSTEDDLTHLLSQIAHINENITKKLADGATPNMLGESWNYIQVLVAQYINSDMPGISNAQYNQKPRRSLCQRLKGKGGRFRGNLSGKRVDFSARTVISPDPNLDVDEVGVPDAVALKLTYPARVNAHNIEQLRDAVRRGPFEYPGAVYVARRNKSQFLKYGDREVAARELRPGDIVQRHLINGDIVLFNRQPSLHRISIMAHRARVMPGRTFRLNECVCTPYNADFDGDEMNLHVPQTEEARAEAAQLMSVNQNLITPRNGDVLVAATQDFLSAAYLLSRRDMFFDHAQMTQMAWHMFGAEHEPTLLRIELPQPAILRPQTLWTGKQLFEVLLRPNRASTVRVNLHVKSKSYTNSGLALEEPLMCPRDGYVVIRDSQIMCGVLDKVTLGSSGQKSNLFQVLLRDESAEYAAKCMTRLARLCARQLGEMGFSIGIDDVTPDELLTSAKAQLIHKGYARCTDLIEQYQRGELKDAPGCNTEETLEAMLTGELGSLRQRAGEICVSSLPRHNAPLIMSTCGSKGSLINISQMVAVVGQQQVSGARIADGFYKRTLPHFDRHSRLPAAKGFVANSFYTGLTPTEFFFHTQAGREGLVDTAVKTAETGYLQRKMVKSLEDLVLSYDGSVRNSAGGVVQFAYGDDELDPMCMEEEQEPVDFERLLTKVVAQMRCDDETALAPRALQRMAAAVAASLAPCDALLARKVLQFLCARRAADEPALDAACQRPTDKYLHAADGKRVSPLQRAIDTRAIFGLSDGAPYSMRALHIALGWRARATPRARPGIGVMKAPSDSHLCQYTSESDAWIASFNEAEAARAAGAAFETDVFFEDAAELELEPLRAADDLDDALLQAVRRAPRSARQLGDLEIDLERDHAIEGEAAASDAAAQMARVTRSQLVQFAIGCEEKRMRAKVEPGATVGALAAQSIGEPATQMTLKTFHFAGVASMNVTLGVPRIKEILNAAKAIKTPVITAPLVNPKSEVGATDVRNRIETVTLAAVAKRIMTVVSASSTFVQIELDQTQAAVFGLTAPAIAERLLETTAVKKLSDQIFVDRKEWLVRVNAKIDAPHGAPPAAPVANGAKSKVQADKTATTTLRKLRALLPSVIVSGIPTIARAVVSVDDKASGAEHEYLLLCEGTGLRDVMGVGGVNAFKCSTNHVMEIFHTLGVEAARSAIQHEIKQTMDAYGINIDPRHLKLLSDLMTHQGEVLGITRFGISKMKSSVLMLASFEKTTDHLFDAARLGTSDPLQGVSESIILGSPMQAGTGMFELLGHNKTFRYDAPPGAAESRKPTLSDIVRQEEERARAAVYED